MGVMLAPNNHAFQKITLIRDYPKHRESWSFPANLPYGCDILHGLPTQAIHIEFHLSYNRMKMIKFCTYLNARYSNDRGKQFIVNLLFYFYVSQIITQ